MPWLKRGLNRFVPSVIWQSRPQIPITLRNMPEDSVILDIGAGSGVLSEALSYDYGQVIAFEPVIERIEFMRTRFEQEGRGNIRIVRGNALELPFFENTFDLAVISGVLEWVPESDPRSNPKAVQMRLLKSAFNLLKPGGYLCLGIENRITVHYLLGAKDPHFPLAYVTIMPRPLAWLYSKLRTGRAYRNYLYTSRGYRKMLSKTGFSNIEIFSSVDSYNDPRFMMPLRDNVYSFYADYMAYPPATWKGRLLRKVVPKRLLKFCGYAYIMLARK